MSLLINGKLKDNWFEAQHEAGEYIRRDSQFRNWITRDGAAGPTGVGGFRAESGRYHLYVSLACPWAHRTLIFRILKNLQDLVTVSVVNPDMGADGWRFEEFPDATPDQVNGFSFLHQVYTLAQPDYTGVVTVPVLWDKRQKTIVNNESSEIIRMFNTMFNGLIPVKTDYYPEALREEIDSINALVYANINNGVYRAGFATSQSAYENAFGRLFDALEKIEKRLSRQRYLAGEQLTEADWRLFTTLVRFDAVYYSHFKCNLKRIVDYKNLSSYLRDLYQISGIAETVNMQHIKRHYYYSHETINPTRIVPLGPEIDFMASHDRGRFSK